ncbi:MAG: Glutamate 5-kinase [Gammaproteobacteria bacterium]|nr:Glutamate 5-kinase [Gammaproteobacteria bacterium]
MNVRSRVTASRRWVVKIGSALLTDRHSGLNAALVEQWIRQISVLRNQGVEVVLVSSGSIVEGMHRLGWHVRPHEVFRLQAAAAVGQMGLVQMYESAFQRFGIRTAQILLTGGDLSDRHRYLNARSALRALLDLKVVPIVNENDTVVTDEIQFGDNDTLAALVTNLSEAELLVILTDQAGLYDSDPKTNPEAHLVASGTAGDPRLKAMAGPGSALGRGGMVTKLGAAEKAARSGGATVICSGNTDDVLIRVRKGEELGTLLIPSKGRLAARKQWLAARLTAQGTLRLDAGAVEVLREAGRSLLPVGVTEVQGRFERGDLVVCRDPSDVEIARGLVNYSAEESRKIIGAPSSRIEALLGYIGEPELIHRDNMVVL